MTDKKIDDKKMKLLDFFVINVSVKFFGLSPIPSGCFGVSVGWCFGGSVFRWVGVSVGWRVPGAEYWVLGAEYWVLSTGDAVVGLKCPRPTIVGRS